MEEKLKERERLVKENSLRDEEELELQMKEIEVDIKRSILCSALVAE